MSEKKDPVFKNILCAIHNVRFGIEIPEGEKSNLPKGAWVMECPICQIAEMGQIRTRMWEAERRLKVLIEAIEIKRTTIDL